MPGPAAEARARIVHTRDRVPMAPRRARSAAGARGAQLPAPCVERCQMHWTENLTTPSPSPTLSAIVPIAPVRMQPSAVSRPQVTAQTPIRWSVADVEALLALPMNDLLFRAHQTHRLHHDPNTVQLSTLLSIKTGGCPEDCAYCPQAARHHTGVASQALLDVASVVEAARAARGAGASRFCMGAAWRGPRERDLAPVLEMIAAGTAGGLEA